MPDNDAKKVLAVKETICLKQLEIQQTERWSIFL